MTEDGTLSKFGLRYFPFTIHPQEWKGTQADFAQIAMLSRSLTRDLWQTG